MLLFNQLWSLILELLLFPSFSLSSLSFSSLLCFILDHRTSLHNKPFQCDLCYKRYSVLHTLNRHIKFECRMNGDHQKFQCDYCSYSAKRKDHLRSHNQKKHSDIKSLEWLYIKNNVKDNFM